MRKNPFQFLLYHTLHVSILTLFLSLFIAAFAFVITFTYIKNRNAIEEFSLEEIERASSVIFERVKALIIDAEQIPKLTAASISNIHEITPTDPDLISYLKAAIHGEHDFSFIYVASQNGTFVGANELTLTSQTHYFSDPAKPLPKEAKYSVVTDVPNNTSSATLETVTYYDTHFNQIGYEQFETEFDSRKRPWYIGAMQQNNLYWTDVYVYQDTQEKGVSISYPIRNAQNETIGVAAADVSFVLLSYFLSQQHIGKSGRTFLLNYNGEVIVNPDYSERHISSDYTIEILSAAYQSYLKNKRNSFLFTTEKTQYLAFIDKIPITSDGKDWLILVLVPHSDFFGDLQQAQMMVLLFTFAILIVSVLCVYFFSKRVAHPIVRLSQEVDKLTQLDLSSEWRIHSHIKELIRIDASIASLRNALRSFARYVPREIVKSLIQKGEEISLGGEKKEITVLFSDIAGFTPISESRSTEEVLSLLAEYFDALSKIILERQGIIDKYIGDSIMAFWGAPSEIPDHAKKACATALQCHAFLTHFNEERIAQNKPPFPTRISLNSGTVIIGNIGTKERMNYTVIGDVVNTAAHLQPVNKIYKTGIIITEETYRRTGEDFLVRPLDVYTVQGKKEGTKIYELVAANFEDPAIKATPWQRELCALFAEAYECYQRGGEGKEGESGGKEERQKAKGLFEQILAKFPGDFPTQLYLERLKGENG